MIPCVLIPQYKEIDMAKLMEDYVEVDTSNVTIANTDRLQQLKDDLDLQSGVCVCV